MTLQFIHEINSPSKASSLYCQWFSMPWREGERLVAIWIDPEMRAVEAEFAREARRNREATGIEKATDDLPLNVQENEMGDFHIKEAQQQ